MKWSNPGHEYDRMSFLFTNRNINYYIWGEGILGNTFFENFKGKIHIVGFIDSDARKQGKRADGVTVYKPDEIHLSENEVIIIATGWIDEVEGWMRKHNLKRDRDYFRMEDFSNNFYWYNYGKVCFDVIGFICNTVCTLKCKNCVGLIPYSVNKKNLTFNEMVSSIDCVFAVVDWINVLALSGGDAIVNKDISRFMEYLGERYLNQKLQRIELYTNGVVLPDDELLKVMEKYNVIVRVSDYGDQTKGLQKITEIENILRAHRIQFERVTFDRWVDIGYPQETNGIFEKYGGKGVEAHCKRCAPVICSAVYLDKLFYCSPAAYAYASGLFEGDEDDWFDLLSDAKNKKSELREFYLGYSKKGFPSYCMKCNGLFNNNPKSVIPGEQL